jgi:hypothetical protein
MVGAELEEMKYEITFMIRGSIDEHLVGRFSPCFSLHGKGLEVRVL